MPTDKWSQAITNKQVNANAPSPSNSELLSEYRHQILRQANFCFWLSAIVGLIGVLLLIYIVLNPSYSDQLEWLVRSIPTAFIEMYAGWFFRQATRTQDRAREVYDLVRLEMLQTEAQAIVKSIGDARVRNTLNVYLAAKIIASCPYAVCIDPKGTDAQNSETDHTPTVHLSD